MLNVTNVSHRYGRGANVLTDVTFDFPRPNGIVALVGASGSGKSTLLGIIGDIITPTQGAVCLEVDGASQSLSWLFQTPNVLAHRTTVANVAIGRVQSSSDWEEALREATETLGRYGLASRVSARARQLSGGETQRMVLARAEIARSRVLLADEPTGQLDFENTLLVARSLRQVADAGTLVIVATHDPAVSESADAIVSITNGVAKYVELDKPIR